MTLSSPISFTDKSYIALLSFEEDRGFFLHISYGSLVMEMDKALDIQQLVTGYALEGDERWQVSASGHTECLLSTEEAGKLYSRLLRMLPGTLEMDDGVPVQAYWDKHAAAVLAGHGEASSAIVYEAPEWHDTFADELDNVPDLHQDHGDEQDGIQIEPGWRNSPSFSNATQSRGETSHSQAANTSLRSQPARQIPMDWQTVGSKSDRQLNEATPAESLPEAPYIPYNDEFVADVHHEVNWILEGKRESRHGIGQVMAVPMIQIGGIRYPAVELSRRLHAAGRYIALDDGGQVEVDLLREIGLGPMGRMADGTPLDRHSKLTPQEIIQRGSERLRGPWSTMLLPGLELPNDDGERSLTAHFDFLCHWGLSGGILGGVTRHADDLGEFLSEWVRREPDCRIGLIGKKTQLTALRKQWFELLEPYWQDASAPVVKSKNMAAARPLIAVPVSMLTQRAAVLPGGVDIVMYLEPDEMTGDVTSKMYRALNRIQARVRLSVFAEGQLLDEPHMRTAQTSLLKLFHSVVREYAIADPQHPLTALPPAFEMEPKRAAQPGLPQIARAGGFAEIQLGNEEKGMSIPQRAGHHQDEYNHYNEHTVDKYKQDDRGQCRETDHAYEQGNHTNPMRNDPTHTPNEKADRAERMEGLLQELSRQGIHIQRPPAFATSEQAEMEEPAVPMEYNEPHLPYDGAELELSPEQQRRSNLYIPPVQQQRSLDWDGTSSDWTKPSTGSNSQGYISDERQESSASTRSDSATEQNIEETGSIFENSQAAHSEHPTSSLNDILSIEDRQHIDGASASLPSSAPSMPIILSKTEGRTYAIPPAADAPLPARPFLTEADSDLAANTDCRTDRDHELNLELEPLHLEGMSTSESQRQPFSATDDVHERSRSLSAIQSAEYIFACRAHDMVERVEDEAEFVPFMSYWPTYESMTWRQKKWYFYWRNEVRNERYPATDLSYIFLLCYEIINGAGWQEPLDGHHVLMNLWRQYRRRFHKMDRYLPQWIIDFSQVHGLNESLLELLLETPRHVSQELADLEWERIWSASPIQLPFALLPQLLDYDLERSRFYAEQGGEVMRQYIPKVLAAVDAFLDKQQGTRLIQLFRPPVYRENERYLFRSAVYDASRYGRTSLVRRLPLSDHKPLREFLTGIVKMTENELRRQLNVNGRLRINPPVEPEIARLIERYVRRAFTPVEELPAPRRVEINTELLEQLQADSAVVRDMLTLRQDELDVIIQEASEEAQLEQWASALAQAESPVTATLDSEPDRDCHDDDLAGWISTGSEHDDPDWMLMQEREPSTIDVSLMEEMKRSADEIPVMSSPTSTLESPTAAISNMATLGDMSELDEEWQDCLNALQPQHIQLLAAMLSGADEHAQQVVAGRYGTMAALLADEINDLAMDHIGDLLLDSGEMMEEYRSILDAIIMR
ncbi:TerB N-terminal domain-containing protein [Paenibacillus kandeliae]|uniref:TerB N-terminal domain-containing protein n=1 Tax=Paenibacillus kandeliae TaxID=3231269 RepID=UPI003458C314